MKIPKARKLPSGAWFIQLRLDGQSVPVTEDTEKECIRKAELIKAEWRNGKKIKEKTALTLSEAIDEYIAERDAVLSPLTVRGYDRIKKNRFPSIMGKQVDELAQMSDAEWQRIINTEAKTISPKTLKNSYNFIKSVIEHKTGVKLRSPNLPQLIDPNTAYLKPDEIRIFVSDCVGRPQSVPMLLALSSMRISEIDALDWKDIPPDPDFIRVQGAKVRDKDNNWVTKSTAKNQTSIRNVPILIPELKAEIERCRKPEGPVLTCSQNNLRLMIDRVCKRNNITRVTPHGLRHSFASLSYHLGMPEKICQEIGGWADSKTMHKIYTHIAQADIERYQSEIYKFYSKDENANENANEEAAT